MVWKVDDLGAPQVLRHRLHAWSAVFSSDGAEIATTSSDQTVRLWDASTLEPGLVLHGHQSEVWCAAFGPEAKLLATGGKDQNVLLWPAAPKRLRGELPHYGDLRPLYSPDGKWLVTVDPGTRGALLWDADSRVLAAQNLARGRLIIGFSRDGTRVATFDHDRQRLQYWQPNGEIPEKELVLEGTSAGAGQFAFMGLSPGQDFFFAIDAAGRIRVWNTETGTLVRAMQGPAPPIRNAVLSPQARRLAVSVESETLARLYDCGTGVERKLAGHRDFVSGLAFSPDGLTLATGSMDATIRLWDAATGICTASLAGHLQEATEVAFSPDGRTLASLGRNDSLKLWHLPTRREVVAEELPDAGLWLRFAPDGRTLAVQRGNDKLWLLAAPGEPGPP
jgi:WD40 repeat protein